MHSVAQRFASTPSTVPTCRRELGVYPAGRSAAPPDRLRLQARRDFTLMAFFLREVLTFMYFVAARAARSLR